MIVEVGVCHVKMSSGLMDCMLFHVATNPGCTAEALKVPPPMKCASGLFINGRGMLLDARHQEALLADGYVLALLCSIKICRDSFAVRTTLVAIKHLSKRFGWRPAQTNRAN